MNSTLPTDINIFYAMSAFTLMFGLISVIFSDRKWAIFPFFGGIMGAIFVTSLGDGLLITAYAYSGGFETTTTSVYPLILVLFLFTILDFLIGVVRASGK